MRERSFTRAWISFALRAEEAAKLAREASNVPRSHSEPPFAGAQDSLLYDLSCGTNRRFSRPDATRTARHLQNNKCAANCHAVSMSRVKAEAKRAAERATYNLSKKQGGLQVQYSWRRRYAICEAEHSILSQIYSFGSTSCTSFLFLFLGFN